MYWRTPKNPLEKAVSIATKPQVSRDGLVKIERYISKAMELGLGPNRPVKHKTILDYLLALLKDQPNSHLNGLIHKVVRLGGKTLDPHALIMAISGGAEMVKLIFSTGAPVNPPRTSSTPLISAVQKDDLSTVEFLFSVGADPSLGISEKIQDILHFAQSDEMRTLLGSKLL